jgi:aspartate aminotransferase
VDLAVCPKGNDYNIIAATHKLLLLQAKQVLLDDPAGNQEHLLIIGHAGLLDSARKLLFDASPEDAATIASIQTVAGTGANHLGALVLAKTWISDPSWINHGEVWKKTGRRHNSTPRVPVF